MGNELLRPSRGRSTFHWAVLGVRFRRRRTSTGRDNAVCKHWLTKLHLHYSEPFTFQDKSLKHLPGREFWTDWHPEPLCRVENKGTLPLPRIVD